MRRPLGHRRKTARGPPATGEPHVCSEQRTRPDNKLRAVFSMWMTFGTAGPWSGPPSACVCGAGECSLLKGHTQEVFSPAASWAPLRWRVHDLAKPPAPACAFPRPCAICNPSEVIGRGGLKARRPAGPREAARDRTRHGEGRGKAARKHRMGLRNVLLQGCCRSHGPAGT